MGPGKTAGGQEERGLTRVPEQGFGQCAGQAVISPELSGT